MFTLKKKLGTPSIKIMNTLKFKKRKKNYLFYFQAKKKKAKKNFLNSEEKNCNRASNKPTDFQRKTTGGKPNIKPTASPTSSPR